MDNNQMISNQKWVMIAACILIVMIFLTTVGGALLAEYIELQAETVTHCHEEHAI